MGADRTRFLEVDFFQFLGKLKNFPEIITSIINDLLGGHVELRQVISSDPIESQVLY